MSKDRDKEEFAEATNFPSSHLSLTLTPDNRSSLAASPREGNPGVHLSTLPLFAPRRACPRQPRSGWLTWPDEIEEAPASVTSGEVKRVGAFHSGSIHFALVPQ